MQRTPYPDVNRLLDNLLSQVRRILPEKLVGLYFYGSLTMGDFDHDISDIDLLAATSCDIGDREFKDLRKMHHDLAHHYSEWDDRIEVAYLSVTALKTFRSHKSQMAIISGGEPFHLKEAGEEWMMNWYWVRESGEALFGPPPKAIIATIKQEEFVQASREHAAFWGREIKIGQERKEQAYAVLTMCRALYTHKNGVPVSKKQAALWAQEQLPESSRLIQNALAWRGAWRDGQVDHAATYPESVRFVNFVRGEILTGSVTRENSGGV